MTGFVKTKGVQYGKSTTATDNFVIQQPTSPDGSLRISNGNIGATTDVVEVDSAGNFKFNSGYGSVATAYAARAWVNFDGTTTPPTIRASGNVSSVTRNATGNYTINFTTAMPDANYSVLVSAEGASVGVQSIAQPYAGQSGFSTTSATILVTNEIGGVGNRTMVAAAIFR